MELVPEKGAQTTEVANGGVGAQNEGLGNRDLTRWGSEGVPSLEPEEGVYEKLRECAVFSGELLVVQHWGFEGRQVWGVKEFVSLKNGGLCTLKPRFVLDIEQDWSDL